MATALALLVLAAGMGNGGLNTPAAREFYSSGLETGQSQQSTVFEMLTSGTPSVPGTVTVSRASEKSCPAGTGSGAISWTANNTACTNNYGIHIERSSTNAALRSQEFDNAVWTQDNGTITADATTAPDGTTTADRFDDGVANTFHRVYQNNVSVTLGNVYTFSIYVKPGATLDWIRIQFVDAAVHVAHFDLVGVAAGTTSNVSSTSIQAANGGFYRVAMTFTASSTTTASWDIFFGPTEAETGAGYQGANNTIDVWGAQIEDATLTSYIRTTGTAATRQADVVSLAKPTAISDVAGCAAATIYTTGPASGQRLFGFGATNRLALTDSTQAHFYDSANTTTATAGGTIASRQVTTKVAWTGATATVTHDAVASSGTYDGAFLGATIYLGSDGTGNFLDGYMENIKLDDSTLGCD